MACLQVLVYFQWDEYFPTANHQLLIFNFAVANVYELPECFDFVLPYFFLINEASVLVGLAMENLREKCTLLFQRDSQPKTLTQAYLFCDVQCIIYKDCTIFHYKHFRKISFRPVFFLRLDLY